MNDKKVATFNQTNDFCSGLGGELPSVHSQEEMDFLTQFVGEEPDDNVFVNSIWLGGVLVKSDRYPDGQFKWLDGTSFDFEPWYPDDWGRGHNCTAVGQWASSNPNYKGKIWRNSCYHQSRQVCVFKFVVPGGLFLLIVIALMVVGVAVHSMYFKKRQKTN